MSAVHLRWTDGVADALRVVAMPGIVVVAGLLYSGMDAPDCGDSEPMVVAPE